MERLISERLDRSQRTREHSPDIILPTQLQRAALSVWESEECILLTHKKSLIPRMQSRSLVPLQTSKAVSAPGAAKPLVGRKGEQERY